MNDHVDEIEPYLYLSGLVPISEQTYMTFNIQKVISILGSERELTEAKKFLSGCPYPIDHTCILLKDNGRDLAGDYFTSVSEEMTTSIKNKIPTLVHCFAGVSRSATLVAAYLCTTKGYNYDQALTYLKTKRSIVNPSFGFVAQLASRFPKKVPSKVTIS
jgi:protein-tyrosine phosphatase